MAKQIVEIRTRWLPRRKTEELVNELLPLRGFSRSLYGALIAESVLVEIMDWRSQDSTEEVVFISYDRFADHVVADYLLSTQLDHSVPEASFAEGGSLAFLSGDRRHELGDLTEAMSIQLQERTGKELMSFVPNLLEDRNAGRAFFQSMVWRQLDAFTDDTHAVFKEVIKRRDHQREAIDTLLTVSTIPDHPFNADFLDDLFRRHSMPDRDAWWSTYLHDAWKTNGPVDRLVDWASSQSVDDDLEEAVVDLAATTLAWMFTTSNRYLRDRATKALVSLLTGRIDSTMRLIDRFHDVDDPYVTERVYAVAYGVAMRSHDAEGVGKIASVAYESVFVSGSPPVHIMLRGYAQGVIERALYLGSDIDIEDELIRPPYKSDWPQIPSEDDLEELTPRWKQGAWDGGDLEWSRNRIRWSVMSDDFARYVIGTNGGSTNWLSLRLEEGAWQSPEERMQALAPNLSKDERSAWKELEEKGNAVNQLEVTMQLLQLRNENPIDDVRALQNMLTQANKELNASKKHFKSVTSAEHREELVSISEANRDPQKRYGPRFDLRIIQRYILWRVFDLGWSVDRFGAFDRFSIGYSGREANKAERMGKKYQWIAYHEILALITDHYQYRERFGERLTAYEGTWQDWLRDIDPSCVLNTTPGGTSWGPHTASWWGATTHSDWGQDMSHEDWVARKEGLPKVEELLWAAQPEDGTRWMSVRGHFVWRQPHPADVEPSDVDRRELWIDHMGYILRAEDADKFIDWAKSVDFWGRWMPEGPDMHGLFMGEFGWSPGFRYFNRPYNGGEDWYQPEGCPVVIKPAFLKYFAEHNGFDCSTDESYTLHLPGHEFVESLGLRWSGKGADYQDCQCQLAAFDPTAHEDGPTALLLREDLLREYLSKNDLALCWTILGEKWVLGEMDSRADPKYHGSLKMSGAYRYTDQGPKGFINFHHEEPRSGSEA